jgi:hypothetical protein
MAFGVGWGPAFGTSPRVYTYTDFPPGIQRRFSQHFAWVTEENCAIVRVEIRTGHLVIKIPKQ